jgi:hypothetical protein
MVRANIFYFSVSLAAFKSAASPLAGEPQITGALFCRL